MNTTIFRIIKITVLYMACAARLFAQRQIEFYEPDFDSAYARHVVMYGGLYNYDLPVHYNQFRSKTAKSKGIGKFQKDVKFPTGIFRQTSFFDSNGYLTGITESYINNPRKQPKVVRYKYSNHYRTIELYKESDAKPYKTFWFNKNLTLASITVNDSSQQIENVFYTYDEQDRLVKVETKPAFEDNRPPVILSYRSFNDDDTVTAQKDMLRTDIRSALIVMKEGRSEALLSSYGAVQSITKVDKKSEVNATSPSVSNANWSTSKKYYKYFGCGWDAHGINEYKIVAQYYVRDDYAYTYKKCKIENGKWQVGEETFMGPEGTYYLELNEPPKQFNGPGYVITYNKQ